MTAPCGRTDCPVAEPLPHLLRRVRSEVWPEATTVHRGHRDRYPADRLVPGRGETRFAPLPGTSHVYLSKSRTAALLESALHHLSGPDPTIYLAEARHWVVSPVRLNAPVRLADLRDEQLDRLGIARSALVDTDPVHYPCTRRWAQVLQHRSVGGHPVVGALWHSRQADLHARSHGDGLLGDLLTHRATEVAVLWHPPGPERPLDGAGASYELVVGGRPSRLLVELSALTGAPIE